mmetsp:Transcript_68886/g.136557  ORF Transcript_68886/g.136557 Transcript_68886/m.136557 type:complete len:222 (-) Transcript_68886:126-791(-)
MPLTPSTYAPHSSRHSMCQCLARSSTSFNQPVSMGETSATNTCASTWRLHALGSACMGCYRCTRSLARWGGRRHAALRSSTRSSLPRQVLSQGRMRSTLQLCASSSQTTWTPKPCWGIWPLQPPTQQRGCARCHASRDAKERPAPKATSLVHKTASVREKTEVRSCWLYTEGVLPATSLPTKQRHECRDRLEERMKPIFLLLMMVNLLAAPAAQPASGDQR